MNLGCFNRCTCVYRRAFRGERVEAEAATNTQRPHRSLIVCLHNKSNVSREIIYTRTVLNKWITRLLNSRIFFMCVALCWCLRVAFVCYLLALQYYCLTIHVCLPRLWYSWGSGNLMVPITFSVSDVFGATWVLWQRERKGKQINTNKSWGPFKATMCKSLKVGEWRPASRELFKVAVCTSTLVGC